MEFQANTSLDKALRKAFWKKRVGLLNRIRIRRAMRDEELREEIEYSLSQMVRESGMVAGDQFDSETGIFVGNWLTDLFDYIINNWESILEMVMTIIMLFAAGDDAEEE